MNFLGRPRPVILIRGPHGPPGGNLEVLGGNTEHLGNWRGMDPFGVHLPKLWDKWKGNRCQELSLSSILHNRFCTRLEAHINKPVRPYLDWWRVWSYHWQPHLLRLLPAPQTWPGARPRLLSHQTPDPLPTYHCNKHILLSIYKASPLLHYF